MAEKNKKGSSVPHGKGTKSPSAFVNNPASKISGRETDLKNIRDKGHTIGSPASMSRKTDDTVGNAIGNYKRGDDEKDFNRAGNVRNQSDEDVNSTDNSKNSTARPIGKNLGVEGKTAVKNVGMNQYVAGTTEGGNHGGGNAANKKFGNQSQKNSTIRLQRNQDGDYKGRKG